MPGISCIREQVRGFKGYGRDGYLFRERRSSGVFHSRFLRHKNG